MDTVKIKILRNNCEEAVGIDQENGNEIMFSRKDLGATLSNFRTDLAPGSVLEARRMELPERAARARYQQLAKAAKKKHQS